jgi:rod shape-determining protein MreC
MLALKDTMEDYGLVAAEVIAKDSGNWFNSFTINQGSADNLAVRQAVITSGGLWGIYMKSAQTGQRSFRLLMQTAAWAPL